MAANVFIDNGPGSSVVLQGKTSDGIRGLILIQPDGHIIPAIGQVHMNLTISLKKMPGYAY